FTFSHRIVDQTNLSFQSNKLTGSGWLSMGSSPQCPSSNEDSIHFRENLRQSLILKGKQKETDSVPLMKLNPRHPHAVWNPLSNERPKPKEMLIERTKDHPARRRRCQ